MEEALGDRLRLDEYKHRFADDVSANGMAEDLAEGQPPVSVAALTLRQWYTRYHPGSGPLKYSGAKELEDALGDELRREYDGFGADRRCIGTRFSGFNWVLGNCFRFAHPAEANGYNESCVF